MEDNNEVLYELSPKFDFFYELTMPTGKKIRTAFTTFIISVILTVIVFVCKNQLTLNDTYSSIFNIVSILCIVFCIISVLLVISKITLQVLEYRGIKYKFYSDHLVCENNFLNQTRKTIEYSNIREVEIRKTVTDRLMDYGVIIIYTNAEKAFGSATVIYAVKNTEKHYNNIESLIHNGTILSSPISSNDASKDLKEEINLKKAMDKKEEYTDFNAKTDVNPLDIEIDIGNEDK